MPKHLIKRYLPDPERIANYPGLGLLGKRLGDPSLWHLNRRSAAGAAFWGLWCAMLPLPGQMLVAAGLAIVFRVNLPLCVALVWSSNPLTLIPLAWLAYLIGSSMLGIPMPSMGELSQLLTVLATLFSQLFSDENKTTSTHLAQHIKPILLGAITMGFIFACTAYVAMRFFWRWHVLSAWKKRREKRRQAAQGGLARRNPPC